jgi:hypothetical protein
VGDVETVKQQGKKEFRSRGSVRSRTSREQVAPVTRTVLRTTTLLLHHNTRGPHSRSMLDWHVPGGLAATGALPAPLLVAGTILPFSA